MMTTDYNWRVGDVFAKGNSRWRVETVTGDTAVLRSIGSAWATTRPLTYLEWLHGDSGWRLEQPQVRSEGQEPRP